MKRFFPLIFFIITIMLCACSSDKMPEAEGMNAFERIECSPVKEYPDTDIHITDSDQLKGIYYESKFDFVEEQQKFAIKDYYEYDYQTGKASKLAFLTEEEKNYATLFCLPGGELLSVDPDYNIQLLNSKHQVAAAKSLSELSLPDQDPEDCNIQLIFEIKSDGEYIFINDSNKANRGVVFVLNHHLQEKAVFYADDAGWTLISVNENKVRLVDKKKNHMYEYVADQNNLKDVGKIAEGILTSPICAGIIQGNERYDFYYYTKGRYNKDSGMSENALIGVKGEQQEKVMDFSVMGIDGLYIEKIVSDGLKGFWVWGTTQDQEMILYHFVTADSARDYSAYAGKVCCKIGCLQPLNSNIKVVLEQFNEETEEYYFETTVYQTIYENRDIAMMHLFPDCQNGKLDGVFLDQIEDEFVKNDVLVDLRDYLLQSEVVSKDQFITHYWESVTDSKGKIYAMYPSFTAIGYAYDEQIDFSKLTSYEALCGEKQHFLSSQGAELDLGWLLYYSGNRFLDEAIGELYIKEDAFKSMLQFIKNQNEIKARNFDPVMQYCEGESLATRVRIVEVSDYLYFNRLFHENVSFSNVGADGLAIGEREDLIGICVNSDKKEVFYDFYDYLFTPSVYHDFYFSGMNLPVLKDEYELWKDYFLATEDYEDIYGKSNRKYEFRIGFGAAECVIDVGSITEEEANDAVRVIQEAEYIAPMKEAYQEIIIEEASAYFSGVRNLDEVCDNMENRLRIALAENR